MATSTISGSFNAKIGSPSSSTTSGLIRTMCEPLSIKVGFVTGKVTEGPFNKQFHMKCLDLIGGGELTEEMLESDPSKKLPSPTMQEERFGKTAATKSSAWLKLVFAGTSEMDETAFNCEELPGLALLAALARWAS